MARKKRGIEEVPDTPEKVLLERVQVMREPYRSYASFCYLFGNRVSEGLGIPKRDIVGYYEYTRIGRKGKVLKVKVPKYVEYEGYELEPLTTENIEYDEKEGILWARRIPTLKKERRPRRDVEAIMEGVGEKPFIDILRAYVATKEPNEYLWTFSRRVAYHEFMKSLGIMPHKLRGLRATKDVRIYEMDAKDLMEKNKWSNPTIALHYVQKNPRERIEKMKRKARLHEES